MLRAPASAQGPSAVSPPDLVFSNGKIVTVDERFTIAQAVAVKGDRIVAVGTNQEIARLAGPNTRTIDLRGRTVIPGLIDNHMHLLRAGNTWELELRWDGVELAQAGDRDAARARQDGGPGRMGVQHRRLGHRAVRRRSEAVHARGTGPDRAGQSGRAAGVLLSGLPEQPGAEGVRDRSRQARPTGLRQRIDPARRGRKADGHHQGRHRRHPSGRRPDAEGRAGAARGQHRGAASRT